MWTKRVYSDSYLTSRPARSAGRTASFNFTTPVASEKCASSVCIKTGVSKGGETWERESCGKNEILTKYHSSIPGYQWGGPVLSRAAMTSSFFRIQVHPVPHLPPQAADAKKKAQIFSQGRRRQEQDVQLPHNWSVWGNTTTLLSLWVCLFVVGLLLFFVTFATMAVKMTCISLQGKPRVSQLNGETPTGRGENDRLTGESDIIQV